MFSKLSKQMLEHKLIAGIIILVILFGGYFGYKAIRGEGNAIRYITAVVEKGTLITSISGSGQVSASDQVDIKPKVSGDVVWVGVKTGQEVEQWQVILSLDDIDVKKAIADAELDLEEAKLRLDKDIAQAPFDYERKLESLQKAKDNLEKEYEDTFNAVSNAFLDLPSVMTGVQNILFGYDLKMQITQWNISTYKNLFDGENKDLITVLADIAEKDYRIAREAYDENFLNFKVITRYSEKSILEELLIETLDTTKVIAQIAKSETNLLDTIIDIAGKEDRNLNPIIVTFQSNLRSYLGIVNNNISSLLAQKRSLEDTKETIINTERDISILEINNPTGINPIDLQIAQNNIQKKEVALEDLKAKLVDYVVRAPFKGVIAKINIERGDSVSSGTVLSTLITKQKIAEITLNEIDVAKVENGQPTTLIFDAVENLTLTGRVVEIDTLGTTTQGVVTYGVKIAFDTQDERIKPGMTVDASIVAERIDSVFLVPNAAVQMQGGQIFVEILQNEIPQSVPVEVGLSNELFTEIISGLSEGAEVIIARLEGESNIANVGQSFRIPGMGGSSGRVYRGNGFSPH